MPSIRTVSFPSSVKYIEAQAFMNCTGLTQLVIGSGVTSIAGQAFKNCSNLISVKNGRSVKSVGFEAFDSCTKLAAAPFIAYVNDFSTRAFRNTALKHVVLLSCNNMYYYDSEDEESEDGKIIFDPGVTMYGYASSKAEQYASENNVRFVTLNQTSVDNINAFVKRLYEICLNRSPDLIGNDDWAYALITGQKTGVNIAHGFVFSSEFKNKNYCNECYIKRLYQAFMGRNYDSAGLKNWLNAMAEGKNREAVFNGFAMSEEFRKLCQSYGIERGSRINEPKYGTIQKGNCADCGAQDGITAYIVRLYNTCLGRSPAASEVAGWRDKVWNHSITGEKLAYGFFFSQEFIKKGYSNQQFVELCYQAFLGRSADTAGLNNWVKKLESGSTRKQVFDGFTGSNEFRRLCNSAGFSAK